MDMRGVPEGLASALAAQDDRLANCVHCGFCLPVCPTYVRLHDEADSPRGRLHLMGAVVEGRLSPASDAFQRHMDRCLGCRACETVCPSGVEYGFLLERAREVAGEARPASRLTRLLLYVMRNPLLFRAWMAGSRLLRWSRLPSLLARIIPSRGPLATARFGMAMLAASLPWKRELSRDGSASASTAAVDTGSAAVWNGSAPRGRVAILAGCVQDHLFRRVNDATRRVLEANGWEVVEVPGEGCCGALHAHAGQMENARELARGNIAAFRRVNPDWIVANAAGCGATMREYGHLMEGGANGSTEGAVWFQERVRDISEILAGDGRSPRVGAPLPLRVSYDPPCHLLHGQGIRKPPLELLRSIPELELTLVPGGDECCGGAGIYGITHPDLGGRIGNDKVAQVRGTGAEVLATGNPGCAMQIGAGLRIQGSSIQVAHPVEILDESYRRGGLYERG
jgi:glycolate oxidase iron-sulfur subunit